MKYWRFFYLLIIGFAVLSCTKENNKIEERNDQTKVESKSILDFKSFNDDNFDHNTRLQNLINRVVDSNCEHNPQLVSDWVSEEFSEEYEHLRNDRYYDLYKNPIFVRMAVRILHEWLYYNQNRDISGFPPIVIDFVNDAYNNIPAEMRNVMKSNYFKMQNGEINQSNYVNEINNSSDHLIAILPQEKHIIVEVYRNIFIQSFEFWSDKSSGGLGGFEKYRYCLSHDDETWGGGVQAMNDNDWPNEATTPKWADNDVIGAAGGAAAGGGWWGALVGGVCGSLMT